MEWTELVFQFEKKDERLKFIVRSDHVVLPQEEAPYWKIGDYKIPHSGDLVVQKSDFQPDEKEEERVNIYQSGGCWMISLDAPECRYELENFLEPRKPFRGRNHFDGQVQDAEKGGVGKGQE